MWEWVKTLPAAVLLFLVLRAFLVEAYKIPSGSMEGTLLVGDFLLVNKLVYGAEIPFAGRRLPAVRHPQYGDVVVFQEPGDPSRNLVKRLIGLPGDTIEMRNGMLWRNGVVQHEQYVVRTRDGVDPLNPAFAWQQNFIVRRAQLEGRPYHPTRDNWGPLVVPTRHLFMLGDNRDKSWDSRYWGFVPDTLVRGTPLIVYYSFEPDSSVAAPWITDIRWSRMGSVVR